MQRGFAAVAAVILVVVLLVGGIVGAAFYLGRKTTPNKTVVNNVAISPLPIASTIVATGSAESSPSGVVAGPYTINYAVVENQIYLKYKENYYTPNLENPYSIKTPYFPNGQNIRWVGILNPPEGLNHMTGFDDILSLKVLPDNKSFIFVTQWEKQALAGESASPWLFNAFLFDSSAKLTNLVSSTIPSSDKYPIPIVDQISGDGKYISFNMHPCWSCDGAPGEKLLMRLDNKQSKRIGWVLALRWLENGKFSFKDYVEKACIGDTQGPCYVDPNTLPEKVGQF